jgi:transposase/GNAT superfamily N-acetyltransferase
MKRTIEMSNEELLRKSVLEGVLERRESQKEAAARLGISERQFRRILRRYRLEGVAGLVSRKRGVPSNRKMEAAIREVVDNFINDPLLKGFGPTLMAEKIEQMKGIRLSKETLRKMMNMMNYNYPYYQRLVENCGFAKEVDFVSSYVKLDEFVLPEKIKKAIEIAKKRGSLTVKSFKNKKEIYAWKDKLRDAYNKSFVKNWEYYPLSDRELKFVIDNAIGFVIPKIVKFILDKDGEAVGFVLPFPDVSATMQKNKGKLGPIEIVRLMRALNQTEWLDFNGIGILPEYQGMGGNALLMEALGAAAREHSRFVHAELTQVAETATQMRKDLANLGVRFYKNHRVYKKELS